MIELPLLCCYVKDLEVTIKDLSQNLPPPSKFSAWSRRVYVKIGTFLAQKSNYFLELTLFKKKLAFFFRIAL